MKQLISFIAFLGFVSMHCTGQNSGRGFHFEAIAKDEKGLVIRDQEIELDLFLIDGPFLTDSAYYHENHVVKTTEFGYFEIIIGHGTHENSSIYGTTPNFENIAFYKDFWLKLLMDQGGSQKELLTQKLLSVPYAENVSPMGTIIAFAGESTKIPDGWLLCDGKVLNVSEYPALYKALGGIWSVGLRNPQQEFQIPDLRGRFIYGGVTESSVDKLGKYHSGYAVPEHKHYMFTNSPYNNSVNKSIEEDPNSGVAPSGNSGKLDYHFVKNRTGTGSSLGVSGRNEGKENRPQNKAVNYIIRAR